MSSVATLLSMLALISATGGLLAGLRYVQIRHHPDAEVMRKAFHLGGGLLALALPWLFTDVLPVLVLGALFCTIFVVIRIVPMLRQGVGQVFLGIARSTIGEFSFVVSVGLLFWLADGDKLLYSVPVMMVAIADALAALIGRSYGKLALRMSGDEKSIEGAVTFFLAAFFCVHVPVLLSGSTGRPESLLVAVNVAAMAMLAEAAVWWGLDNLVIPIWAYIVLKSLLQAGSGELFGDLAFLLALGGFMYFWRSHTTLGDDAVGGAVLWGYVVWSVGALPWVIAPLLQFATYSTLTTRLPLDTARRFRFPVVLANIAASIPWLLAYRQTGEPLLHIPFAVCFSANVAIIALVRARSADPALPSRSAFALAVVSGLMVLLPSVLAVLGAAAVAAVGLAAALPAIVAALLIFQRLEPRLATMPVDAARWLRQAGAVAAASLLAFAIAQPTVQLLGIWST